MRFIVLIVIIFGGMGCPTTNSVAPDPVLADSVRPDPESEINNSPESTEPTIEERSDEDNPQVVEPTSKRFLGVRSWAHLSARSKRSGVTDRERDIIMSAAADFDVPSGLLYGIWSVESGRLSGQWHRRWQQAKLLPRYGSACARRYGIIKCRTNWTALQRICSQKRNGQPICDPNRVRTSRALAMGPMQHLPIKWSPADGVWASYAVDYDQDGTFDPHDFADAVASSAGHLRHDYELGRNELGLTETNAWRHASRMYLGQATARRYERKVYQYLRNWCSVPGYCQD
ncbi:lytic murein transglycosylase [Patescibacteria group bacterium]|nr:lytic murein transglycosylase [Patescibacteria group bacterium]MBU1028580.1 lytic murein transglycosylase [Patescibacteria group bacterium]MBU1915664.1 lytic murein transglycosylase [Patescibacteria group bacterium]